MLSRILPFLGRKTENNSRGSSENKTENSGVMDYTETPENDDFRDRECDCFLGWKKKGYRKWHGSRNSAPRGKSISPVYPSIEHTQTRSMSVLLKKFTHFPHWNIGLSALSPHSKNRLQLRHQHPSQAPVETAHLCQRPHSCPSSEVLWKHFCPKMQKHTRVGKFSTNPYNQ